MVLRHICVTLKYYCLITYIVDMTRIQQFLKKGKRPGIKVERIYRILLDLPYQERTNYRIAKDAGADYHWTIDKLRELEEMGVIKGSKVIRPVDLFTIWASRPNPTRYREYHIQEPLNMIKEAEFDLAITTYFAEQLVGNYLFPRYLDIYIHKEDAAGWHEFLVKRGLVGKGNVRILLADEHVFWKSNKEYLAGIVCVQQLIVDLLREGGVCTEAAELLMERFYGKERTV